MIKFSKFFTYMTTKEKWLMFLGTVGALLAGFLLPCMAIAVGELTDTYDPRNGKDKILDNMKMICLYICLVGIASWIFGYMYFAFWQHLAQNISFDLRSRYLHAILNQEVAYFELENVEQLPS
jgi:ATP-binding cassette subfamily B (MDR/TAP) protein 1